METCLFFNNCLYRANTTRKVDASSFTGFDSTIDPLIIDDMDWIINTKVREIVSNKKKTIFHSVLSQEFLVLHFNKNTPYELWIDSFNNKYFRAFLIFIEKTKHINFVNKKSPLAYSNKKNPFLLVFL